jgi:hypothetical protein
MSMRSYSALLIFENIYDYIPTANPDIVSFSTLLFNPNVPVVSVNCNTTLGNIQSVDYELEGEVELATGLVISMDRINQLLFQGIYTVATRTLDTCIAPGGVCQACYAASRQTLPVPAVGSRITIYPEYGIETLVIKGAVGQFSFTLDLSPTQYEYVYIYIDGVLQTSSQYSISDTTLTLNTPLAAELNVVVRYTSLNTAPYLVWLANRYSGALLGLEALPSPMLPVRSLLLTSLVPQNRLQLLIQYTNTLSTIPANYLQYLDTIADPLEQSLFMLALNSIFASTS